MAVGYQPIREISEKYFGERPLKEVTYDYSINGGAFWPTWLFWPS